MDVVGKHLIVNFKLQKPEEILLSDIEKIAEMSNAKIVESYVKETEGVRIFVVLVEESHVIMHYHKDGSGSLDVYTCGEHSDPHKGLAWFISFFRPKSLVYSYVERCV